LQQKIAKDFDSPEHFKKYFEFMRKIPSDSNLVAQEAGLKCLACYVQEAPVDVVNK
jgi:hypothetical protein